MFAWLAFSLLLAGCVHFKTSAQLASCGVYFHSIIQGGNCTVTGTEAATLQPLAGFWRGTSGVTFIQCINTACLGGQGSPCKEGYQGQLCTECKVPEYGRDNQYDCSKCPDPVVNQLRLIGGLVVLVIIVCVVTVM
jgi:hypothetical protein